MAHRHVAQLRQDGGPGCCCQVMVLQGRLVIVADCQRVTRANLHKSRCSAPKCCVLLSSAYPPYAASPVCFLLGSATKVNSVCKQHESPCTMSPMTMRYTQDYKDLTHSIAESQCLQAICCTWLSAGACAQAHNSLRVVEIQHD